MKGAAAFFAGFAPRVLSCGDFAVVGFCGAAEDIKEDDGCGGGGGGGGGRCGVTLASAAGKTVPVWRDGGVFRSFAGFRDGGVRGCFG